MQQTLPNWVKDRLPEYEKVDSIPQAFSDSTHHLWSLQGSSSDNRNHFLKVFSNTESPFWQIMRELFDFDLRSEIADFSDTYTFIDKSTHLDIPELIKAEAFDNGNAYILTSELRGKSIASEDLVNNDQIVKQMARHLGELHSRTNNNWGSLNCPLFSATDWSLRIEDTLFKSAQKWGGVFSQSDKYLKQALGTCALIEVQNFVPMMPDLRWDQFLQKDGEISALVDLDAFIFAPRELDFVILEYLLSPNQISVFSEVYSKHHAIPDISQVRPAYRLLLFYMQILGETDLEGWMNKEAIF